MSPHPGLSLDLSSLRSAYSRGDFTPVDLLESLLARYPVVPGPEWILRLDPERLHERARALATLGPGPERPLYGIPFAIKDNIDVAGLPTTAACPAFAHVAARTATVVRRLLDAGAMLIGKTNLDQFATGLVGVRSPYGIPSSVYSADHLAGGSSSGSAVVVASAQVSFALGTDTAGSGRIPAAFNGIAGTKPTRGLLPCTGVVPACRSLDCVSVFALTAGDAWQVLLAAAGDEPADPWSRPPTPRGLPLQPRIGVLRPADRIFFGDTQAEAAYAATLSVLAARYTLVEFDFAPFREAAAMLYSGPWLAERLEAAGPLLATWPEALDEAVRSVISKGLEYSAADAHGARTRLAALQKQADAVWSEVDLIVLPTAATHYRISEVLADPLRLNSTLGIYTNFANLLDLCAVAVPTRMRSDGLPFGVTLFAPAWHDAALANLADELQRDCGQSCGITGWRIAEPGAPAQWPATEGEIRIAVVGAHLSGMPLNGELSARAARFVKTARTSADYRLHALKGTVPPKPGLSRTPGAGAAIEVEIWAMSAAAFGDFVARIPSPLGIGTLTLEDGEEVKGFLCEAHALAGAEDISGYGGWRAYVNRQSGPGAGPGKTG